jgi:hypothetical protein
VKYSAVVFRKVGLSESLNPKFSDACEGRRELPGHSEQLAFGMQDPRKLVDSSFVRYKLNAALRCNEVQADVASAWHFC